MFLNNSRSAATVVVISFLFLTSLSIYTPYIFAVWLWDDVFTYIREAYDGAMPWGHLESHRPFRTITWNVATFLGAYSRVGLQAVVIALHLICSILVYCIVAVFLPGHRSIAFVAATLRLVWTTALVEGTDDIIIEALVPEAVWLIATLLWAALERRPMTLVARWTARVAMGGLIFLAMGMYEQVWGNILLLPVVLVVSGALSPRTPNSLTNTSVWVASSIVYLMLYFGYFGEYGKPEKDPAPILLYFEIYQSGIEAATIDTIAWIAQAIYYLPLSHFLIVISFTIPFSYLYFYTNRVDDLYKYNSLPLFRSFIASLIWFFSGSVHTVVGLANLYGHGISWGSRFCLSISYPSIMVLVSGVLLLSRTAPRIKPARFAAPVFAVVFFGHVALIIEGWAWFAERASKDQDVAIALSKAVPSVAPGTVLVIEGQNLLPQDPDARTMADVLYTVRRRNLYGVRDLYAFVVTAGFPAVEGDDSIRLQSEIVYPADLEGWPPYLGLGTDRRYLHTRPWPDDGGSPNRWIDIDRDNIVWLRFRDGAFEVVEEKSNVARIQWSLNELHKRMLGIGDDLIGDRPPWGTLPSGPR